MSVSANRICFGLFLFCTVYLLAQAGDVKGQTKTFLNGTKTGNRVPPPTLLNISPGTSGLSSPMLVHQWGCLAGIQTNQFRFYYGDNTLLNSTTTTPTTITASRNLNVIEALSTGGDAYIQFRNTGNQPLTSGTPVYFKLGQRPSNTGISVAVGKLLGLVELNSIKGRGYTGAANYLLSNPTLNALCTNSWNGSENNGNAVGTEAGTKTQLLIDQAGDWFAKVTPNADYNSVRLSVAYPSDLNVLNLATEIKTNVYHAFTMSNGDACNVRPYFTSPGEATGITLVTESLGIPLNQLVSNPQQAIDGNPSTFSSLSTGVANVGVASSLGQTFYFDHTATSTDAVTFNLELTRSLVDLNLLGNGVTFRFYNNDTQVGSSQSLRDLLLDLNLLHLITVEIGSVQTSVTLKPTVNQSFNRVSIQYETGLVNANVLGDAMRIYEVALSPEAPQFSGAASDSVKVCKNQTATLAANTAAENTLVWYENASGGSALTAAPDGSFITPAMTADKTYYVAARKCATESARVPVEVIVNPLPTVSLGGDIAVCQSAENCDLIYTLGEGNPTRYSISWSSTELDAIGETNFSTSPIKIPLPQNLAAGTYLGNINVKNANGCAQSMPFNLIIHPKPAQVMISPQ